MGILHRFAEWLQQLFLYVPRKVFEWLTDGIGSLIDGITLPAWWSSASGYLTGISSDVLWMLSWFEFGTGVGILVSAYGIRFLIRRLPIVG